MALTKEELIKKINDWRKDKSIKLSEDYLDYLDSYIIPKNIDVFAIDDDTGEELDDYTPEFEAAQAEVLNDLGLSDREIDEIMGNPVSADNSDESDDKPHEEDILPDGEESELEKKMTPEEFKIASNITGRSTGDFEPETPEDVQFMLEANKNGLKVSDERLKNVQSNSINSIANTLKNYRW